MILILDVAFALLGAFLLWVGIVVTRNIKMFYGKHHGRMHSSFGSVYLLFLMFGVFDSKYLFFTTEVRIIYDICLSVLGIGLAISAANEFKHKNVQNFASGTLDEHATVTHDEMIEHSFYQGLNLIQILYLHSLEYISPSRNNQSYFVRQLLCLLATSSWYFRSNFPINKFSDNFTKMDPQSSTLIRALYRIKKYQYIFYKHFLLHGLNITVAIDGLRLANQSTFRLYWMLLNISYVMEFFLQTMVKKKYLQQSDMLTLQRILMSASTIAAVGVIRYIHWLIAIVSIVLNFVNRKNDVGNVVGLLAAANVWNFMMP